MKSPSVFKNWNKKFTIIKSKSVFFPLFVFLKGMQNILISEIISEITSVYVLSETVDKH